MDPTKVKMVGYLGANGDYVKGIEDYLPNSQYETEVHHSKVVEDILDNWVTLSRGGKFHAIFATSSIPEAIEYYRLIKNRKPDLKITCLFDPTIDNGGGVAFKEDGLVEIIKDYNSRYEQSFTIPTYAKLKKYAYPKINSYNILDAIEHTSINLGSSGKDSSYGYGLFNFKNVFIYLHNPYLYILYRNF